MKFSLKIKLKTTLCSLDSDDMKVLFNMSDNPCDFPNIFHIAVDCFTFDKFISLRELSSQSTIPAHRMKAAASILDRSLTHLACH